MEPWLIELETTVGWLHSLRAWEVRLQRLNAALPAKERAHFAALQQRKLGLH